jgi:hypothetical protein
MSGGGGVVVETHTTFFEKRMLVHIVGSYDHGLCWCRFYNKYYTVYLFTYTSTLNNTIIIIIYQQDG